MKKESALNTQKIVPCLWFDRQAEEAAHHYASIFANSKIGPIVHAGKTGTETHGVPEGAVLTVEFEIEGLRFAALNGGPLFHFTPAISFLVACRTAGEVDALWGKLTEGGTALMDLGEYPFSERYGWTADKYGLSWQVMAMGDREIRQKIVPTLMYVGEQCGKAEAAIRLYTSVFDRAKIGDILRYGPGEEPDKEGTVKHAGFTLEGLDLAAQESAYDHAFTFTEAISLMRPCETQGEIDRFWEKLTADGGEESMCGWLKDKFGVSWQIVPAGLDEMLRDPDPERVARVMNAFLKMRKIDIAELERAFRGETR